MKDLYSSYKDLPLSLYQIQTKYRDEARPRAGLLRGREFVMKDSYSFDIDDAGLDASLPAHRDAYIRIFDRLGFDYVIVSAMSGRDGRLGSRGVPAPMPTVGEDTYVRCTTCDYAANVEAVAGARARRRAVRRRARPRTSSDTPGHPDHRDAGRPPQRRSSPRDDRPWTAGDTLKNVARRCSRTPTAPASRWRSACPATARST